MCRYSIDMGVSMCMPSRSTVVRDSDCLQLVKDQSTFEMTKPGLFKITKCRQMGDIGPTLKNEIIFRCCCLLQKKMAAPNITVGSSLVFQQLLLLKTHILSFNMLVLQGGVSLQPPPPTHPANVSLSPHLQIAVQALLLTFLPWPLTLWEQRVKWKRISLQGAIKFQITWHLI